jgi:hypothetical protein
MEQYMEVAARNKRTVLACLPACLLAYTHVVTSLSLVNGIGISDGRYVPRAVEAMSPREGDS